MRFEFRREIALRIRNISYPELAVIIGVILNSLIWSVISLLRYYSMMDSVFDSGIISLTLGYILHYTNIPYLMYMSGFSLDRILFSPLILIDGIPAMLVIQEITLSIPAYIIFKLAQMKIKDNISSMLISLSYLIYFPLAGAFYFDYHFQSFFIMFFLLGIYLFETRHYKLSTLSLFLAGSVRFPFMVFPFLFVFLIFSKVILNKGEIEDRVKKFAILNTLLMGGILIISYFIVSDSYFLNAQKVHSSSSLTGYFHIAGYSFLDYLTQNIENKILTVVLIFSPFLFIPIRKFKWLIFTFPYLILLFLNNYEPYIYPYFNHYVYSSLYVPFLFLLILDNIKSPEQNNPILEQKKSSIKKIFHILKSQFRKRRRPVVFFIIIILTAVIFQPYSPVNSYNPDKFNMNIYPPNMANFADYVKVVNLIPQNDPYILYQGNLPYVDVHDPALSCLDAYRLIAQSSNYSEIMLMNGSISNRVDYVLGYLYGNQLSLNFSNAISKYYSTQSYGMEAFLGGFLLLAKNYTKPPVYLSQVPVQNLNVSIFNSTVSDFTIPKLTPGIYNFNFSTDTSAALINFIYFNTSSGMDVNFSVLGEKIYHGKNLNYVNVTVNVESFLIVGYVLFNSSYNSKFQNVSIFGPYYVN